MLEPLIVCQAKFLPSRSPRRRLAGRIEAGARFLVDRLYGDYRGGQRVLSRLSFLSRGEAGWLAAVSRHWNVDRRDPP
jgi:hypothetical protein